MTLRAYRKAVKEGGWVLDPSCSIDAKTKFQRDRLSEAVSTARLYLGSQLRVEQMADSLRVTPERAAQIVRLGIKYLKEKGCLRPAAGTDPRSQPHWTKPS